MKVVIQRSDGRGALVPVLAVALLALPLSAMARQPVEPAELVHWPIPVFRVGGVLAYDMQRESGGGEDRTSSAINSTLNVATNTYLWAPWIALAQGELRLTYSRNVSQTGGSDAFEDSLRTRNQSIFVNGSARLQLLPYSKFPFEAHIDRSDSRASSNLALGNDYVSTRFGVSQQLVIPNGAASFAWDRSRQRSDIDPEALQDSAQISLSQSLGKNLLQLTGSASRNTRESTEESATQGNLALSHSYTPAGSWSLENQANLSTAAFELEQGDSHSRVLQASSLAMWRNEDEDLTATGGVRMIGFSVDGDSGGSQASKLRGVNLNGGLGYELSPYVHLTGTFNVNQDDANGIVTRRVLETAGATYQPEPIQLGKARYSMFTSVNGTNAHDGATTARQLAFQFGHHLGRSVTLDGGSRIGVDGTQNLGVTASRTSNDTLATGPQRQLGHGLSLSWDYSSDGGVSTAARLSANDSRELGGNGSSFQMVNLQATSSMATSAYSSWNAALTVQAIRQQIGFVSTDLTTAFRPTPLSKGEGVVTVSSGSMSYQNSRVFKIARLRFTSDLRLNSQALLPILGKAADQQTAVWENRFDYSIGRTLFRLSMAYARSPTNSNVVVVDPFGTTFQVESKQKLRRGISFSVSRGFGQY